MKDILPLNFLNLTRRLLLPQDKFSSNIFSFFTNSVLSDNGIIYEIRKSMENIWKQCIGLPPHVVRFCMQTHSIVSLEYPSPYCTDWYKSIKRKARDIAFAVSK